MFQILFLSYYSPDLGLLFASGPDQKGIKYANIYLTDELRKLDGLIIECRNVDHLWVFDRIRNDRLRPNGMKTIDGTRTKLIIHSYY